jgi:hypothetical protein
MAKNQKKVEGKETKSEFLRKALSKNPNLDYDQVIRKWAKSGHTDGISSALYYQIRAKLGIKTEWVWVREPERGTISGEAYQFKITLMETKPPIWRRIQVADCTLGALHKVIQIVMGWRQGHMHQFIVNKESYGEAVFAGMEPDLKMKDENGILLSQIIQGGKKPVRFLYEYDFGDGWQHEILFEKTVAAEPNAIYPRCLEGARACPPEDVGGVWGYVDFLEAIGDPEHEEHQDMKEWIGGKFDPEKFSVDAVNKQLRWYNPR